MEMAAELLTLVNQKTHLETVRVASAKSENVVLAGASGRLRNNTRYFSNLGVYLRGAYTPCAGCAIPIMGPQWGAAFGRRVSPFYRGV